MADLAESNYRHRVIKDFAEQRFRLFHTMLPQLGESEIIRLYGPTADKGMSEGHITTLLDIVKTKDTNDGIEEYATYLESNLDERVEESLQICIRAYRVKCAADMLKDGQSVDVVTDTLCLRYNVSVRESRGIVNDAMHMIREEYAEASTKDLKETSKT